MENQPRENVSEDNNIQESPTAKAIHNSIIKEAEHELKRPTNSLFWSGLAAGSSMGFSLVAEGLLEAYLPNEKWSTLVSNFGYSLGFIIVILGKQQLFTENTLTPILPLFNRKDLKTFLNVMRLWGVVLFANLLGSFLFALLIAHTSAFSDHVVSEFIMLGERAIEPDFGTTVVRGILAGWLIALMVWLLPSARSGQIWVILIVTYIIGIGHFSHVIAGSVEAFTLAALQKAAWTDILVGFIFPSLIGNIAGGVILVAALNHAQIKGDR